MSVSRPRAVLFVDVTGSTRLYEELGDAEAHARVAARLRRIGHAVAEFGGRTVKHLGDGLMCAFTDATSAVRAAHAMQLGASEQEGGAALTVHVGCHYGPVLEEAGDLYGDCVNVSARIAGLAASGQIIVTREVVEHLGDGLRRRVRRLGDTPVKGRREPVQIFEYLWDDLEDATVVRQSVARERVARLRLAFAGFERWFDGGGAGSITLGRDASSDVVVADREASRRHAHIEARREGFVLLDHSANGTYVTVSDGSERCLRRRELVLWSSGHIALGRSTTDPHATVVEFTCA